MDSKNDNIEDLKNEISINVDSLNIMNFDEYNAIFGHLLKKSSKNHIDLIKKQNYMNYKIKRNASSDNNEEKLINLMN